MNIDTRSGNLNSVLSFCFPCRYIIHTSFTVQHLIYMYTITKRPDKRKWLKKICTVLFLFWFSLNCYKIQGKKIMRQHYLVVSFRTATIIFDNDLFSLRKPLQFWGWCFQKLPYLFRYIEKLLIINKHLGNPLEPGLCCTFPLRKLSICISTVFTLPQIKQSNVIPFPTYS